MKEDWTEQEQWTWGIITSGPAPGNAADLAQHYGVPRPIDKGVPDDRRLVIRNSFLQEILTSSELHSCVTLHGIHITHAIFEDYIDLAHIRVNHKLRFDECLFKNEINLEEADISSWLSFAGSVFSNPEKQLKLRSARLRELDLVHVVSLGSITMDSARIDGHILLQFLKCPKTVDIVFAEIKGSVDLSGAILNEVNLSCSRTGEIRLGAVSTTPGHGQAQTRWIEGTSALTLSNTEATSWQDRGEESPNRYEYCDAYSWIERISTDVWPSTIRLDGFSYKYLGGYVYIARPIQQPNAETEVAQSAIPSNPMLTRDTGYFKRLLELDRSGAIQPYQQLASVFRAAGYSDKAAEILYEGRERDRRNTTERGRRTWLSLLKWTIGYGIGGYTWRVMVVVAAITLLGAIVLSGLLSQVVSVHEFRCLMDAPTDSKNLAQIDQLKSFPSALVFSIHKLVPLFGLNVEMDKITLSSCLQGYFYVHKIAGWFLGSVLIAAVAGLTQRQS